MSIDIKQKLQDLATACSRAARDGTALQPETVHDVALVALHRLQEYERAFADTQRIPHNLARIATALEQAAGKGWGNVFGESLLDAHAAQPGEDS